jgi:queuine tRNA-ribosyltransferase
VVYPDIRRASAQALVDLGFPGYAIGGLSVGEPHKEMYEMVSVTTAELPANKPRYLMGVGTPSNLLECVARGVDMFDCVMPTRNGRNGQLFTTEGIVNIKNAQWTEDYSPIDPGLDTYVSQTFTKAYVRHLIKRREYLGLQIASQQNLAFYCWLMREARAAIQDDRFAAWKGEIQPRVSRRL